MTQPNLLFPEAAFNFDSIAELAVKDQEDWMDEIEGRVKNPFLDFAGFVQSAFGVIQGFGTLLFRLGSNVVEDVADFIRDGIEKATSALNQIGTLIWKVGASTIDGVGDAIRGTAITLSGLAEDLLHNTASVIGAIPQHLVSGLNGALNMINSAVSGARNFVQQVIDAILSGLRGIPIIGGFIPDLNKAVKQQKADQEAFTISAIVSDYRNPPWVCRYPISDVTYAEVLNSHIPVFGDTGEATAGTAHTHPIAGSGDAVAAAAGWSVNQYESRGSYMTITNTTVHDTMGVIVWKDAGTLNNVFLEVFKENADSSLTRVYSHEFSSSITTTTGYFEFTLPSRLVVQSGERFLFRIRNSSSVATTVRLIGVQRVAGAADDGFKTVGSALTAQTTYTSAQATTARGSGNTLNWFMLAAKSMPSVDRLFSDSFKRIAIGGEWVRQSSTAALLDVYEEALGYTGTADGSQSALYIRRCSRDTNRVSANLYVNPDSTAREGLLLHASRDFSQVVYLGVNGSSAKIFSGPIDSLSERASLGSGGSGKWSLYYDDSADKYVALLNDVATELAWTSVGSAVVHDADHRFGGARIECLAGEPAGTLDDWELRDWSVAVVSSVTAPRAEASIAGFGAELSAAVTVDADAAVADAAGVDALVEAVATVDAPTAHAAASGLDVGVSVNDHFPYAFPFGLT